MPPILAPEPNTRSGSPFSPEASGGPCSSCTYWLASLGCCRSDCANFRSLRSVDHCRDWKRATSGGTLPNVYFSRSPWPDTQG